MSEGLGESHVMFEAGTVELEGVLARPERDAKPVAVLLLAPHPRYGGAMDNNVVAHLARRASSDGCITLRFNFGGVGQSGVHLPEGVSLGEFWAGMDETQDYGPMLPDALGAFERLRQETGPGDRLIVLGYSMGSVVGGLLAKEVVPDGLAAVSPPVSRIPMDVYRECAMPKRFVWGTEDFVCSRPDFEAFFAGLPGEKSFETLDGCDHFFGGQEERIYQSLRSFLLD